MEKFEFFVEKPIKVEVEAETEEEAIKIIYEKLKLYPMDNVKITKPVEAIIDNINEIEESTKNII